MSPEWRIVTKEEVYELLRLKFLERVQGSYISATKGYANHIWDTDYLAYGLENDVFSNDEVQKIYFNHGDTPESYIQQYRVPNLLEDTLKEAFEKFVFPCSSMSTIREGIVALIDAHCPDCC